MKFPSILQKVGTCKASQMPALREVAQHAETRWQLGGELRLLSLSSAAEVSKCNVLRWRDDERSTPGLGAWTLGQRQQSERRSGSRTGPKPAPSKIGQAAFDRKKDEWRVQNGLAGEMRIGRCTHAWTFFSATLLAFLRSLEAFDLLDVPHSLRRDSRASPWSCQLSLPPKRSHAWLAELSFSHSPSLCSSGTRHVAWLKKRGESSPGAGLTTPVIATTSKPPSPDRSVYLPRASHARSLPDHYLTSPSRHTTTRLMIWTSI